MATKKKYIVELHASEIELLGEALDSHAYWQLTEPHERRPSDRAFRARSIGES